jgi:exodeoxyribonuclease VII small subunit
MSRPKATPPTDGTGTGTDRSDDELAALGYREAVAELDAILDELDREAVDVDDLARQVRRAAELIRHCRKRITGAQIEVERVVSDLADLAEPSTEPGALFPGQD